MGKHMSANGKPIKPMGLDALSMPMEVGTRGNFGTTSNMAEVRSNTPVVIFMTAISLTTSPKGLATTAGEMVPHTRDSFNVA